MPGLNGTGPMGNGPRTGGGRGLCSPATQRFENNSPNIPTDFESDMGFGRGFGRRSHMGMRRGFVGNTFQNQTNSR